VTVTIPRELETAVQRNAQQRKRSVENVVQEALEWYLRMDTEFLDELAAWQEVRDEAVQVVEGSPSWNTLIIPLTSRLDALRFPATWRIDPTPTNGLSNPSVALIFQLGAADIRRIRQRLGRLNDSDLQAIQSIAKQLQKLP
jgi:mRNA-degrading endonuclease toxin of MazEF toxin-antitoxin module